MDALTVLIILLAMVSFFVTAVTVVVITMIIVNINKYIKLKRKYRNCTRQYLPLGCHNGNCEGCCYKRVKDKIHESHSSANVGV